MHLNNKFGTHVNLFILYRHEAILLFWIHLPEEVWHVVMAKKGEIQNYCFDKESNISLQWCGCSFRVFLDYWCFEKVQSHSQLNKKGLSFKPSLNTQSCNRKPLFSTFTFENVHTAEPKKKINKWNKIMCNHYEKKLTKNIRPTDN